MSTAQILVAIVTTLLTILLGTKTGSKIVFAILLATALTMWSLNGLLMKAAQTAADKLGAWTGLGQFNIQGGFPALVCVGLTFWLAVKTKSRVGYCLMAVVTINLLGIDPILVEGANSIGNTITEWAKGIKISF